MIQVDGIRKQVCIKLVNNDCVQTLLRDTSGEAIYKHHSGELSTVGIAVADLGMKRVRVANIPAEVPDTALTLLLAPFGKVLTIEQEIWTKMYRYLVANGTRQITIMLTKHILSHLTLTENSVLLSYDGQLPTCYVCGKTGHMLQTCPKNKHRGIARANLQRESYAAIAAQNDPPPLRASHNKRGAGSTTDHLRGQHSTHAHDSDSH
jgi:hypothetical protein